MYVVSSKQMKKAEQTYVDSGACEFLPLMERAGTAASKVILQRENPAKAVILCGSERAWFLGDSDPHHGNAQNRKRKDHDGTSPH